MKWIFLWSPRDASGREAFEAFAASAREAIGSRLRGIEDCSLHLTERAPPRLSIVPYARKPLAMVTVHGDDATLRNVRRELLALDGTLSGYAVRESTPRATPHHTPRGERTPGLAMITVFRKHPRMERTRFFDEWFAHHTPLALAAHPTIAYVRNAVDASIVHGSRECDGIVIEHFAEARDVLSPVRLFGGATRALPNMVRVGLHAPAFLDMGTLTNHLAVEYAL